MKQTHRLIVVGLIGAVLVVSTAVFLRCRPPALYTVTVLPSEGGRPTFPAAINDRGQIVGFSRDRQGNCRLVLWDRERRWQDLGPVGEGSFRINNAGQISGVVVDSSGRRHAFFRDPNGVPLLVAPGRAASEAHGLNNRGQVVGAYWTDQGARRAFLWDRTEGLRDLGPGIAVAINDAGQILVLARSGEVLLHGGNSATSVPIPTSPHGSLSLNNRGQVVGGHGARAGGFELVRWQAGAGTQRLMRLHDWLSTGKINDANQVLVTDLRPPRFRLWGRWLLPFRREYYLWDPVRGPIALRKQLPAALRGEFLAYNLNNQGCIVGAVVSRDRMTSRPVLLEPIRARWRR